ncbi:MAG: alpha/beta hydrolase-fold protein [Microscillaceae bacterium]|nr:alpha/beta hydrolase-fold protein [Microscillaceae bacterium]MDW8461245.1 alpha/beta hydrolase-fold protein [Cytophagales bacterium]
MQESYHRFYSHRLGREISMLVFGHWGYPVLIFPTSRGRYYEAKDFKLVESARWFIETGKIKLYCIDSIDVDSWYAYHLHPAVRVYNHTCYDRMLNEELVPAIQWECNTSKIGVAGCSFGGYHAVNFAFKHPEKVGYLFSMGGAFDIKGFLHGYYDENVYFNNPVDFIPNAFNEHFYRMGIVLGTSEYDICRGDNEYLSHILHQKGIPHWLDIRPLANHDWPIWREMFPHYLSQINF